MHGMFRYGASALILVPALALATAIAAPPEAPPEAPAATQPGMVRPVDTVDPVTDALAGVFALRDQLTEQGITFSADLTLDWSGLFTGGAHPHSSAFRHLFNAGLSLDSRKLLGYPGGTFHIAFQNINGDNGSADVGDIQGYDCIDAEGRTQLSELWYEQKLFDDKLRLKIGKVDANSEFACNDNAGDFLHSGCGKTAAEFPLPSYPDPAMSVNVFVYPTEQLYAGVGWYDGSSAAGNHTGDRGPATFFSASDNWFVIGEVGAKWTAGDSQLAGRLGVGGWWHGGTFDRFDGSTLDGTQGFYLTLDQQLWRADASDKDDARGVAAFLKYSYADPTVNAVEHHIGAGLTWTGAIPTRADDVLGAAVNWALLSNDPGAGFTEGSEVAVEVFYKAMVTRWLAVQPDVMVIFNPGGDASLDTAVVGTLRVVVTF